MPNGTDPITRGDLRRALAVRTRGWYCCWIALWAAVFVAVILSITAIAVRDATGHSHPARSTVVATDRSSFCRLQLKSNAKVVAKDVFYLGTQYDGSSARAVQGYMFFTRKLSTTTSQREDAETCVQAFANGARWKETEDFVLDHTNDQGLSEQFFLDMNWMAMCEWDTNLLFRLFGDRDATGVADGPDDVSPDGKNEIQFGVIDESGVIAATTVWGIFDGPVQNRVIVEGDILYNLNFAWGNASTESGVMDGQNIAAHELGHYVGFGHVPDVDATMFGSASFNEIKKRTLLPCEVAGLCAHYGEECGGGSGSFPPRFSGATPRFSAARIFLLAAAAVLCASLL